MVGCTMGTKMKRSGRFGRVGFERTSFLKVILLICVLACAGGVSGGPSLGADMSAEEAGLRSEARAFADDIERGLNASGFSTRVGSAAELIGPYDSRAGYARIQLQADVNDHFREKWGARLGAGSWQRAQLATGLLAEALASRGIQGFPVRLADGSSVRLRIDNFMIGFYPTRGFELALSVEPGSARTGDGAPIDGD